MSQKKQDEPVHPIKFYNRTMKSSGRNDIKWDLEALVVILGLKKFRLNILSYFPFIIIKEYQALRYEFAKKDMHGRLSRWSQFLAE